MKKLIFILFLFTGFVNAQQLAFPTAKGAGASAIGGYSGKIIHVTTLIWEAEGGLKEAIQTPGPRTIVFDVSGEIDASNEGDYSNIISGYTTNIYDNITIAGQTAPAGGITIKTSFFRFESIDNIIIRHIRFRRSVTTGFNASTLWFRGCSNYIVDHCSFSHGGDETFDQSSSNTPSFNGTIQHCFFSDNAKGMIIGTDTRGEKFPKDDLGNFTFVNNVFANTSHRFPNVQGKGQFDIINNSTYNWKFRLVRVTNAGTYNVMNNYYKGAIKGIHRPGWFTDYNVSNRYMNKLQVLAGDNPLIHTSGNVMYKQREIPQADDRDMWTIFDGSFLPVNSQVPDQYFTKTQFPLSGVAFAVKTAQQAHLDNLKDVGANKTLNSDGSIYTYQDTKDAGDILMIKNDSYNGSWYDNVNTVPYPVIPENVKSQDFYVSNPHIPEDFLEVNGIVGNSNTHNLLAPNGLNWFQNYLNAVDGDVVYVPIQSVSIKSMDGDLELGDSLQLDLEFLPNNTSNKSGVWFSTNSEVATVNKSGLVVPIKPGKTTIGFGSSDNGNVTASFVVNVLEQSENKHLIILITKEQ